jgi:hypothetical protein
VVADSPTAAPAIVQIRTKSRRETMCALSLRSVPPEQRRCRGVIGPVDVSLSKHGRPAVAD